MRLPRVPHDHDLADAGLMAPADDDEPVAREEGGSHREATNRDRVQVACGNEARGDAGGRGHDPRQQARGHGAP
ncbi:MAG TPA: hypothetical protein VGA26_02480 [Candidatus Limnocylindria bacterium]